LFELDNSFEVFELAGSLSRSTVKTRKIPIITNISARSTNIITTKSNTYKSLVSEGIVDNYLLLEDS
jgi:hypothetical protein